MPWRSRPATRSRRPRPGEGLAGGVGLNIRRPALTRAARLLSGGHTAVKRTLPEMIDPDEYAARILTILGGQVREARNEHGWTQRELAERAGVHVNVIGSIERGRSAMRISTLVEVAGALETTSADLLGETERRLKAELAAADRDGS